MLFVEPTGGVQLTGCFLHVIGKDTAGVRDRAAALKAKIDSAGMKIWSVHLPYSKRIDISLVDSARRANAVNYVRDMMKVAGVFQAERVVLHPSYDSVVPDDRADRIKCCRASIAELAPVAAEIGAKVLIPHHHDFHGPEKEGVIEGFGEAFLELVPDGKFISPAHGEWIHV